jgi:hypothetical protein
MNWVTSTFSREKYTTGGWNISPEIDDDTPKPPEPSPLDSAQSRRAAALLSPLAGNTHRQSHRFNIQP